MTKPLTMQELAPADWMGAEDRSAYDLLLSIWREFMAGGDHSLGYRSRDSTLQADGSLDFEQQCSRADYATYLAVDACIDSLAPHHRSAIWVANGQARALRFVRLDPVQSLIEAEKTLLVKLRRNPCTAIKF